tara:strand:- start:628 stop:747 length:120 start_codon:yes stop_codon:yes gene_type:complete
MPVYPLYAGEGVSHVIRNYASADKEIQAPVNQRTEARRD